MFWNNIINKQLLVAHRGYSSLYPENTMLAFEKALKKFDLVEFDVQFTKDGIAVILHDETLIRTSDILEISQLDSKKTIYEFEYNQIKDLNMNYKNKIPKQTLPKLSEFLDFANFHQMPFNLEIKDLKDSPYHNLATKIIIDLLIDKKSEDLALISSFNFEYIKQIREENDKIQLAALYTSKQKIDLDFLTKYKVNAVHTTQENITDNLIKQLHKNNIFIGVYTINEKEKRNSLFKRGINLIFTDNF